MGVVKEKGKKKKILTSHIFPIRGDRGTKIFLQTPKFYVGSNAP